VTKNDPILLIINSAGDCDCDCDVMFFSFGHCYARYSWDCAK